MASRIQGITIELNAKATPLVSALRGVQNQIRTMKSGLRDVDRLLKFNPTSTTLLTQKQKLLQSSITATKEKLKTLKDAMEQMRNSPGFDENSEDAQRLQREIVATEQELKRLESEYGRFASITGAKMQAVGAKMQEVGRSITAAGEAITTHLTLPLAALAGVAIKSFSDVDKGMDAVAKRTGATGEALESMQKSVRNLATQIPTDFETAGDAVGQVNTRFKLTGQELEDLSGQFVKFAQLNNTDVATSIDAVQSAMAAFGLSSNEAGAFLDTLNAVSQQTGADVNRLAQEMTTNAASLKEMGMNASDAAHFLGELSVNGIDSSSVMAGLKKAFAEATKEGKPLDVALSELQSTMKNADSDTQAYAAALDLFGNRAGPALAAAIQDGRLSLNQLGTSLEENVGNIDKTFEATLDPVDKFKMAVNQAKLAGADLGKALLSRVTPMIEKLQNSLQKLTAKFEALSPQQKDMVIKAGMIAAAIGPVLVVVGKLTTGIGSLVSGVGLAMSKLTALGEKVGILAGGPLALGLAAAAALAGGMYALNESGKRAAESLYGLNEAQKANLDVLNEATSKYKETVSATDEASAAVQSQYGYIRDLVGEYNSLVDANGQIAEADKARADFIINTLAESLGMEKGQIMDLVGANGKLTGAIDEVIQKKEAEAYLDANYDSYVQAIQLQTENTQQLAQALVDLNAKEEAAAAAKQRVTDAQNALNNYLENGGRFTAGYKTRLEEANRELQATQGAVDKAKEAVNGYADASEDASNRIANYEALKAAAYSGSEAEIAQALQAYQNDLVTATTATQTELQTQAETTRAQYEAIKAAYDSGQAGITQAMVDAAKVRMDTAATEAGSVVGSAQQEAAGVSSNSKLAAGAAKANAIDAKIGVTTNYDASKTAAVGDFQAMSKSAATEGGKITSSMTSPAENVKKAYPVNLGSLFHGTIANITSTIKEIAGQRVSVPTVSGTTKFAKAYTNPFIFTAPTLIGSALVGDRGSAYGGEMIYGRDNLMRDISEAANPISAQELYGIIVAALDKADMKVNISGREFGRIIREY